MMSATGTDADKLIAFLAGRLTFVLRPDGRKYATQISASGFRNYPIESAAFRDAARRLCFEHGEPYDDAAFEIVRQRLLNQDWRASSAPQSRVVMRALRALRAATDDARAGKIDAAGLYLLGEGLRTVIEAATEHAATSERDHIVS